MYPAGLNADLGHCLCVLKQDTEIFCSPHCFLQYFYTVAEDQSQSLSTLHFPQTASEIPPLFPLIQIQWRHHYGMAVCLQINTYCSVHVWLHSSKTQPQPLC